MVCYFYLYIAFPSCRAVLTAMAFFGFINIYCLRVNLSVALVAMVNTTYIRELNKVTSLAASTGSDGGHVVEEDKCHVGNATRHTEVDVRII